MPDIVLTTLNAKYAHSAFGLRYLLANLGPLRDRAEIIEFDISQRSVDVLEFLLARHPKVRRAALVGVPDAVFGEVGWAFVVPRDPADPPTLVELRAFTGAELASFKRPDGLTLLDELPITPNFKVDRQALRALVPAR